MPKQLYNKVCLKLYQIVWSYNKSRLGLACVVNKVSYIFHICNSFFLNKWHSVGLFDSSDFFNSFVKQTGKHQTAHKQAGRNYTLTPSEPTSLSPQVYRGHKTEISPGTQFMATKKRPEAKHRGKRSVSKHLCHISPNGKCS